MDKLKNLLHMGDSHEADDSTGSHHGHGHGTGSTASGYHDSSAQRGGHDGDRKLESTGIDPRVDSHQRGTTTSASGLGSSGHAGPGAGRGVDREESAATAMGQGASGYDATSDNSGYAATFSRTGNTGMGNVVGNTASGYTTATSGSGMASHVPGTDAHAARRAGDEYDPYSSELSPPITGPGSATTGSRSGTTATHGNLASYIPGTEDHALRQSQSGGQGYGAGAIGLSTGTMGTTGMGSAGIATTSGAGLTGSSLPDRSVGATGSSTGQGLHFTQGPHKTDTANRWDPRVAEGDLARPGEAYTSVPSTGLASSSGMTSGTRDPYATTGVAAVPVAAVATEGHHHGTDHHDSHHSGGGVFSNDPTHASSIGSRRDPDSQRGAFAEDPISATSHGASTSSRHHTETNTGTGLGVHEKQGTMGKVMGFLGKDNKQENKYADEDDHRTAKEKYYGTESTSQHGITRDPYETTSSSGQHYGRDTATVGGVTGAAAAGAAGIEHHRYGGGSASGAHERLVAGDPSYERGTPSGPTGQGLTSGREHYDDRGHHGGISSGHSENRSREDRIDDSSNSGKYGGGDKYKQQSAGSGELSVHERLTAGDPSYEHGKPKGPTGQGLVSGKESFDSSGTRGARTTDSAYGSEATGRNKLHKDAY